MDMVLGIDVGGTSIKVGLFTPDGTLLEERRVPTPALVSDGAFAVVIEGVTDVLSAHGAAPADVVACGLDIPGPVADDGTVGFLPNIELDPEGLLGAVRTAFPHATVAFVNDANAAALGEVWGGAARGVQSFVLLALGTGVGGGVVTGGRLVAGAFGAGGEIGHITVERDEPAACGCGRHGCLEQFASAKGIVRMYLEECARRGVQPAHVEHATDTLSVFGALAAGDECARLAVDRMCDYLALAMSQISCVMDPELYLIGGGVAGAFEAFGPTLRDRFRQIALPTCKGVRIELAGLGNRAAMYGCAYEALRLREA